MYRSILVLALLVLAGAPTWAQAPEEQEELPRPRIVPGVPIDESEPSEDAASPPPPEVVIEPPVTAVQLPPPVELPEVRIILPPAPEQPAPAPEATPEALPLGIRLVSPPEEPAPIEEAPAFAAVDEEEEEVAPPLRPADVVLCYLSVEFMGPEHSRTLVRVDVDDESRVYRTGNRHVEQYAEGVRRVRVTRPRAWRSGEKAEVLSIELKPYVYTKLIVEQLPGSSERYPAVSVHMIEDGVLVRTWRIEL